MKNLNAIILVFVMGLLTLEVSGQDMTAQQYIDRYKLIAIRDRFDFHIPASITLAQGLLESGNGNSMLARKANNHFGIKCHSNWKGKRVYKDDDAKDECFRVYKTPEDSYIDHAHFLSSKSRYEFLFHYPITDYKAWARGLKKAGYATNPKYPKRLIGLIERYGLDKYDKISRADFDKMLKANGQDTNMVVASNKPVVAPVVSKAAVGKPNHIMYRNRVKYIIVYPGETIVDIARFFDIRPKALYRYNDLSKGSPLKSGMIIYLQPKRKKGDVKFHIVNRGETAWEISQMHAIKLRWLMKRNHLKEIRQLKAGQKLFLRRFNH